MGSVNAGHTKGNGGADASRRFASLFNRNAKGRGFKYASGGQGASVPERAMGGRRDGPADDAGGGRFLCECHKKPDRAWKPHGIPRKHGRCTVLWNDVQIQQKKSYRHVLQRR